ncbi:MAG: RNA-directed DNA polymerase [Ruminococcaceae bacterium]|nr:RNA-directed DNA polymerase [Oscillospiraceae bacterium]
MKWKERSSTFCLEPQDMQIIAQCKMSLTEMVRHDHPNKNIPPLWSVLSYVMLQSTSHANIWYRYRALREMASNTKLWYYTQYIPKSNGGARRISVPTHAIRTQQKYILAKILKGLPVSDHAYAYREGRSIQDCAKPHESQDVLIHLDLTDFFGSISENMVFLTFYRETGYSRSLCRFLAKMCCLRGSLPQGTVTSPMLSNIVFYRCDEDLARLAARYGMNYTRYSDDLYFSGNSALDVGEVLKKITRILLYYGFRINEKKTKIRRRQHRQTVLGLTVNDHIQVSRKYRRDLLQELYYLDRFGENCKGAVACGDYLKYMQQLQGKLAYVLHADPENVKMREAHSKLIRRIHQYSE